MAQFVVVRDLHVAVLFHSFGSLRFIHKLPSSASTRARRFAFNSSDSRSLLLGIRVLPHSIFQSLVGHRAHHYANRRSYAARFESKVETFGVAFHFVNSHEFMHRFWIFPLICGFVGAVTLPFSQWQSSVLLELQPIEFFEANIVDFTTFSSTKTVAIGAALGVLWGSIVTVWNFGRNRLREQHLPSTKLLLPNLFWCGIYVSLLVISGAFVFAWIESKFDDRTLPLLLWLESALACLPFVANTSSIIWATTRTVTQTDVLTPRVIVGKWKRSSTLETRSRN